MLLAAAMLAGTAAGHKLREEPRPPRTPGEAADRVQAAFAAGDALDEMAARDDPDPWRVADLLCQRGAHDAADAFARAAPRKDVDGLPAYVAAQRARPADPARVAAAKRAIAALRAGRTDDAETAIAGVAPGPPSVSAVDLRVVRAWLSLRRKQFEESSEAYLEAAGAAEEMGWFAGAARALDISGSAARRHSDLRTAIARWERLLLLQRRRGDRRGEAYAHNHIGNALRRLGSYAASEKHQRAAVAINEETRDRAGLASALGSLGLVLFARGEYEAALKVQRRSLPIKIARGDRRGVGLTLGNIGLIHSSRGDLRAALDCQKDALRLKEDAGDLRGAAATLNNLASVHQQLGELRRALALQERSLAIKRRQGNRWGVARSLLGLANILESLGHPARALRVQQQALDLMRAIGDRPGAAKVLGNMGLVHAALGDDAKALEAQTDALTMKEELGDWAGVAMTLANLAAAYRDVGRHDEALAALHRALELSRELGDRRQEASCLGNLGLVHKARGEPADALRFLNEALAIRTELGRRPTVAATLVNIGSTLSMLGRHEEAIASIRRGLAIAEELGLREVEARAHWNLGRAELALDRPAEAVKHLRSAALMMRGLVRGFAEQQGASAREQWANMFDTGLEAALRTGDPMDVCFFIESGRAGALLESLGGRDALRAVTIPEDLRDEERSARAAEAAAARAEQRALATRERRRIRAAKADLAAARARVRKVDARIQREAKAAVELIDGEPASPATVQGLLGTGTALVSYAWVADELVALVTTRDDVRTVRLGPGIAWADPVKDAATLRARLIEPLRLEGKRLIVAPHGPLAYVPFALIAPDKEVCYVPSMTTFGVLARDRAPRGTWVLALGDPVYTDGPSALPATRAEAKAIGDVVLLGNDATEARLAEVVTGDAWRAVHLACHGLVDTERPTESSLILTADPGNDGRLKTLEVVRYRIDADLVVLSACDTAKGKLNRAEGVMGFVRAFMLAGARRTIVSLWKVDDEATSALMRKFYELWKDGATPTATALKQAQQHVASHDKWKAPHYWAAWQLWGLPE